jgi:hypothetical protein
MARHTVMDEGTERKDTVVNMTSGDLRPTFREITAIVQT